ncbi:sigma-54 interaction domain-containing protein [Calidifontibacillus oryziterrae]|uniref:sigma-54 interaction domain-containing protein n=1 Tax=Calidifontibacillus oryziterrae TaxID=1191699 RepID=UPI00030D7F11|nr:sigma-54-dependent Fis family transcriptional regulator [Calidifontibacillus oryziterrae]
MQNVLIIGAGVGGTALLKIFMDTDQMRVKAIIDINSHAPGILFAKKHRIPTGSNWECFFSEDVDVVVDATGDEKVFQSIREKRFANMVIIPGSVAYITVKLMSEKENLISELKKQSYIQNVILNTTHDGMMAINTNEEIILFNNSSERIMGIKKNEAIGEKITAVFPSSKLPRVLETGKLEVNQEQELDNGSKIITTRIPMKNEHGDIIGAFAVFKDITDVVKLAEEITNLKDIKSMLEAIIQSSDEAISVVDEHGNGIMINPAYTRITGLTSEQIVGKPATADISEGESMHLKVLQTKKPVRGVRMKVGPKRRDVIVNVAPVIVDGILKGSVGVIHDVSEIKSLTEELQRAKQIIRTLEAKYSFEDIIGSSDEMQFAIEQAKLGAKTPATVLLRGESGTGKELFAHAIHNASDRRFNKFIRVNCAALSESLLESELFGYEEGAFSGAKRGGKKGLFEEANNGSIFLDEIGELSANTQAKLLRVLQEHEIVRVGGTKSIPINVRVIAATNVNLEKAMATGKIREDLFFRINKLPIHIPPLRDRREDIPLLCHHLLQKINQDYGRKVEGLTTKAIDYLLTYRWPGNVRELENVLARAVIYMNYNEVLVDIIHLPVLQEPLKDAKEGKEPFQVKLESSRPLSSLLEEFEAEIIQTVLIRNNGNKTKTANDLKISLRNLYYKIEKYNIANNSVQ